MFVTLTVAVMVASPVAEAVEEDSETFEYWKVVYERP